MDRQYLENLLHQLRGLESDVDDTGMAESLPLRAELPVEPRPSLGMGDSLQVRAELPYARPEGMAASLNARAELPAEPKRAPAATKPKAASKAKKEESVAEATSTREPIKYDTTEQVLDAQDASAGNLLNARLFSAGQTFNEAMNRTKFDKDFGKSLVEHASDPVKQVTERQAAKKNDLAILQDMYKNATTEVLSDPNSDVSRATRDLFAKMGVPLGNSISAMDIEASDNLARLVGIEESIKARQADAALRREEIKERREDRKHQLDIKNIGDLQNSFNKDKTVVGANEGIAAAKLAESLLLSNTPIADEAIKRQLARLSGEVGVLTDQDVNSFGGSKAIQEKVAQSIQQMYNGRLTDTNRKFMGDLVKVMKLRREEMIRERADHYAKQGAVRLGSSDDDTFQKLLPGETRPQIKRDLTTKSSLSNLQPQLVRVRLSNGQTGTMPAQAFEELKKREPNAQIIK
jgi:hypothetical protein